jgi:hypothetical protein
LSILRNAACFLLGAAVALGAVAVHRSSPPFGLFLALGTTYVTAWWLLRSRLPAGGVLYVVGWLGVLAGAVLGRPEGDFVIANDVRGWSMLLGGAGLVVLTLVSFAVQRSSDS